MKNSKRGQIKLTAGTLLVVMMIGVAFFYLFPSLVGLSTGGEINVNVQGTDVFDDQSDSGFTQYNIGFLYYETISSSGGGASTTSPSYNLFHSQGNRLSEITTLHGEAISNIASGTTATNFPIEATDGDYIFLNVDTGSAEYPDVAKIMASNSWLSDWKWVPVTSASVPELVVEVQISKISNNPNYQINPSMTARLLVPCQPDDVALSLSSPSDQTSIGTTAGTDVYVSWEITSLASNQGAGLARLYLTSNQTSADYEALELEVLASSDIVVMEDGANYGNTYTFSSPANTAGTASGVTQFWRWYPRDADVGTDISKILFIAKGSGDADSIRLRVHFKTYFTSSGHGATAVMGYRLLSAGNSLQTAVTDSVELRG